MDTLDLPDIQGIIVRGYRMPMVRYFLLKVKTAAAARAALGRLTSGDEGDAPQITTIQRRRRSGSRTTASTSASRGLG
jgi:hypothetical protein